ncbi:MAG: hypothetical protein LBC27_05190 [Spirochaetaceae bacterium]|jgi:hypothetical protein|nr:hypothetical protein [Spirochaetaceae bacterium]
MKRMTSGRRVKPLKKAVKKQGMGLCNTNSGRHPANVTGEAIMAKISALKKMMCISALSFARFREPLAKRGRTQPL